MSALRKINVRGMRVEIWETSFRIEGMSQVMQVGPNLSDERVKQLINTIYDRVRDDAERNAKMRIKGRVDRFLDSVLDASQSNSGFGPG